MRNSYSEYTTLPVGRRPFSGRPPRRRSSESRSCRSNPRRSSGRSRGRRRRRSTGNSGRFRCPAGTEKNEVKIQTKGINGLKCCGSGTFVPVPGSEFFPSRVEKIHRSRIQICIEEFLYSPFLYFKLTQKIVSKHSEI
jgi:hypothetical protein